MQYVSTAAVIVVVLSTIAPPTASGALNLSITNYQAVSDQRASLTKWYVTFKADLVNTGPALPAITATITAKSSNVEVVAGQGALHFSPVPANGRVTSADSFTLLIDRAAVFDWSQVEWSFVNPVANAGPNQTAPVIATVTLDGTACSNPSGMGTLSYSWALQSVPPGSAAALSGPNTPKPSFLVDAPGVYKIKLTVSNGFGSDSAIVSVSTINSPPVAMSGPNQTVSLGATVSLNGSKSSDVDGDVLRYSWSLISLPAKSSAVLFGASTAAPSFVADAPGVYKAQLVVNDGKADSQPSTVTISTINSAPVADAGDNQTVVAGMFVQLSGARSTDVDGDGLTYRWGFNSVPPGSAAVIANAMSVNPTFTADKAGTYIVQLIVNDGKIDSAASTVTITTNAVQAPTAKAGQDVTVHAGATVQLDGFGTDPQNFQLSYNWSLPTRPPNSTASLSATNIHNPTFIADLPGIYAAQLLVSNGTLSSAPSTVTITTTDTPPVANPGPDQVAYVGDTVYLDGSRSYDSDRDPITAYSWTFTSKPEGSTATLSGANTMSPTFVADLPGTYVAQLIVSDSFASSQAKTVTVDVGTRTMVFTPAPLNLYNSPATLSITLSPIPASPVPVTLNADTPGVATFSPNPATVPANSSGVNVTVTPTSPGTTKVTASASGYYSSSATVTVSKPSISIALNGGATTVGLTYKACGGITLNAPAPSGGTIITLSSISAPDGAVSFDANTVAIAEGGTTSAFCVTGSQFGTTTMTATSPGYNSGAQTIGVVMVGSVSLPSGASVGTGQSAPLNVRITTPAPAGGVTVTLTSSDTNKLTISPATVQIKAGATAPDTPPQISGPAGFAGEATVTASAAGFYSDRQSIKVIATITFKDQAVSVGPGGVKSITLLLSAPAPTGGLLVQLTSSDDTIATVPQGGALISAGQQSVDAQISGGNIGTADITVRANPSIPGSQYFSGAGSVLRVTVAKPSLTIATASLPAGTAGANYPTTFLSATGGTGGGYVWSIAAGALPSGLTLGASGAISGALSTSATTSTFTLQVQDSGGNKDTKSFTITVNSSLTITTTALPDGAAGAAYPSTTLAATGGTGAGYAWSLLSGALPTGLTLSTGGVISGTLSNSATSSTFTIVVHDNGGTTASKQFTITVGSSLTITTASLPVGTAGAIYPSTTLAAYGGSGSNYLWSVTAGSLPSGLVLSLSGVISGSLPTSATSTTFTIQVKDSDNNTSTKQFSLTVDPVLSITTTSLPGGMTEADYTSTTLAATGGSSSGYSWSIASGTLPSGLTLSAPGVLSGTLAANAITSIFTIQVQDSVGATATKQFTITVLPALTITTVSLPDGTAGASYPTRFLAASGGSNSGYAWSISAGSLPSGLTLNAGGMLSGSLSESAITSTFTVRVQDGAGNVATKLFTLTVNAALVITTTSLPAGAGGAAYTSTTLTATGGSGSGYTWSLASGMLPSGLTLSAGGVVSGTLSSTAVNSEFTVQVRDSAFNQTTKSLTIAVTLTITTASLPAANAGKSYSTLMGVAGGTGTGYSWSVTVGSLPANLTLSPAGVLSGVVSSSATGSTFTLQVRDNGNNTASKQFSLAVNPPLSITTESLPTGNVGAAYPSTPLAATGGSGGGYSWFIVDGALPLGLSLSAGGVISGTPSSAASTSTFTVLVQDSASNSANKQFTITVGTVLTISTGSLPAGDAGSAYGPVTLTASGGSGGGYTWSITGGSLPSGLSLSAAGVISGTLSGSPATVNFTAQVQDSANNKATKQFSLTVNPALVITTASLPPGAAGSVYPNTTLAAGGGSGTGYSWTVTVGPLPAGLTLSAAGVLAGTLSTSATTSTFTVQVQDSLGVAASKAFTIIVNPQLTINNSSLPDGMAGADYPSTTLTASGGAGGGYSWSISNGAPPAGLSLSAGGVLSGTLSTSASTSSFTVQVQDSASNHATKIFTVKVNPALAITTAALPAGIAGNAYPSTTLVAAGGSGTGYTWSISDGALPAGLTLSAGGVLSGTLSSSATASSVTIQVQDSGGYKATRAFAVPISPALGITTASLPDGVAGAAYASTTLEASGGTGTGYTWSLFSGSMPAGLTLSPAGAVSGTLSASATGSTFTLQVKDSGNNTARKQFTITVGTALVVKTGELPIGIAGANYAAITLAAAGGTGTGYSWSVSDGSLPAGLTLSATGVLVGNLSASASTATFTVAVKDSGNNTATKTFTLTVNPALSIAVTPLPVGVIGSAYPSTTLSASGGTGANYTWLVTAGSLPAGLALSTAGVISGTVAASATTQSFTVQVKDSGSNAATRQFTININPAVNITTAALPAGTAGTLYPTTTLAATGGTGTGYSWSILAGSLPSGLNLSSAGALSGTLSSTATTSTFTIVVQDSGGNSTRKDFTITVTLTVTTTALPGGTAGAAYTGATLAASGGTGAGYTWSLAGGSLPAGLSLSSGGAIAGSLLSSAQTSTFTVQVQDSASTTAVRQLTITVTTALTINAASLPTGMAGAAYPNTTLSASGGTGSGYAWSVSLGSLPTGLTLSGVGVISGTLSTAAATATFTVQVKDSANNAATRQFTLSVNPALTITTSSPLPSGIVGSAYPNTTLAATGGSGSGYTWSITVGSLPAGLSLSGGVISGTPSVAASNVAFTLQVKDTDNNTTTKSFAITVNPALSITTTSLSAGISGTQYTCVYLGATGGTGSGYTWSIVNGSLPPGMSLAADGNLCGTPTAAGSYTFTPQVKDSGNNTANKAFTIVVNPALSITTASPLSTGIVGNAYPNTTLAAAGGTGSGYTWSLASGSQPLPTGLGLTSGGVISGTPSTAASYTFTIQVKDNGNNTVTKQFTIPVNQALSVTTAALPSGILGAAYPNTTLTAAGGTGTGYTWSLTANSAPLPTGLSLGADGAISGTLSASATTATVTVQVKDSGNNAATKQLTIKVYPPISITTPSPLPSGLAGSTYPSTTLVATGGTGTGYAWSLAANSAALPTGLNLTAGGVISGTLSISAASATFTVQVKDSDNNTITKQFTITVNQPLSITTASPLTAGIAGNAYPNTTLAAAGGTGTGYTWSLTAGSAPLPAGLGLSAAGVISGTPSTAGSYTFTIQVKDDGNNTSSKSFTITVNPSLSITTASPLPTGIAGKAYPDTTLAATGGTGNGYAWSLAAGSQPLPTGLSLSAGGLISGTLSSSAASATFTVQVKDDGNNTFSKSFTITVNPPLSITTASLPDGVVGGVYPSTTLAASGGAGSPYTWTVTVPSLPSGLTLSTGGTLSGTLSALAVTSTFTVQVKDSANNSITKQFTITVKPAVSITTPSLPDGVAGTVYPNTTLVATGGTGTGYAWSVMTPPLPAGLSLSADGTISGTLSTSAVTSTFTIKVVDNGGNSGTKTFTITVNAALTITTASPLPSGMVGAAYPQTTLTASGGTGTGYSWSAPQGLPAGLTLTAAGVLSGTPSSSSTGAVTFQVKDNANNTATKQLNLTVYAALSITTASLPGGTAGSSYTTTTLAASGGTGAGYTWSIKAGSGLLPTGLTLSGAGVISGTPSAPGTSTFTVQVIDNGNFTATKQFTITIQPGPLVITANPTLPNATVGVQYSTPITVTGGTSPYTWSSTTLPAWLSLDSATCGGAGIICGTPPAIGTYNFSITVRDSTTPTYKSVSQAFALTVNPVGGIGTITVPNVSVGVNLQAPILISLSRAPSTAVKLTITSGNASAVLLSFVPNDTGLGQVTANVSAGDSNPILVYVKALMAASPVTLTVAADSGYTTGSGTVTVTNSGFVIAAPNGVIGGAFNTYEGVTSSMTVLPYRLGPGNVPLENQPIRAGLTVNVPVAVSPTTMGSMGSPTVTFSGGDQNQAVLFTASFTNTGNASIIVSPPSSFVSPSTGGTLNVTIQQSGFILPTGITVGRNLEAPLSIGLNGPAASDTVVTVTSSDDTALRFATGPGTAGAGTIQVTIRAGFTSTPQFWAQARSGSGSVSYTVSATGYGSVTASMPLGPSGFVIVTPAGTGADFTVTLGGPDPTLTIYTALFDTAGKFVQFQTVAPGATVTATLTSAMPGVGTVGPATVQVPGGADYGSALFHAVSVGTTKITAQGYGYTGASVNASVSSLGLYLDPVGGVGTVGQFLEAQGAVHLTAIASADVTIRLTSNSPSLLQLAVNATDPGANFIDVVIKAGTSLANFWVYGKASSGAATYTASGAGSATDTVTLAPSAVALYLGNAGNPSCLGLCTITLAGGAKTVSAVTYALSTDGTNTIQWDMRQPLAGGSTLTVPLRTSAPGVGTIPASASIVGGTGSASFSFTPSTTGTTIISTYNLAGWTSPAFFNGTDLTQVGITVQ